MFFSKHTWGSRCLFFFCITPGRDFKNQTTELPERDFKKQHTGSLPGGIVFFIQRDPPGVISTHVKKGRRSRAQRDVRPPTATRRYKQTIRLSTKMNGRGCFWTPIACLDPRCLFVGFKRKAKWRSIRPPQALSPLTPFPNRRTETSRQSYW